FGVIVHCMDSLGVYCSETGPLSGCRGYLLSQCCAPPFRHDPATAIVHFGRGSAMDGQDVSPSFQFFEQVGVLGRRSGVALGNAAVVVGGTMPPDVLERRAEASELVARQLREEGEAVSHFVRSLLNITMVSFIEVPL